MQYVSHDNIGRITGVFMISKPDAEEYADCLQMEESPMTNISTQYILDGEVTERPTSPVTLTGLTLTHLPVGGELFIDGTRYEITEDTVALEFPLPGTYSLRVESFPDLPWTGSVTV